MDTLLDHLQQKLKNLPEKEAREVLAFVESLQAAANSGGQRGSAERVLSVAGSMSFDDGELDGILADIQLSRELDMER